MNCLIHWLTIGSGSQFSGVATSREIPKKNEGQRSAAAPGCPSNSVLGAGGRWFESSHPDHFHLPRFHRSRMTAGARWRCRLACQ
jgi:hypothetical protein